MLYVWLLLFYIKEAAVAMNTECQDELTDFIPERLNDELPPNYKEIIGEKMVKCAEFIAKGDIDQATKTAKEYYEEFNPTFDEEDQKLLYNEFKNLYNQMTYKFSPSNYRLHPDHSIQEYIFEDCLGIFYWNYL